MKLCVAVLALLLLAGCAAKPPREVVDTVCFAVQGMDEHGARLAQKAAKEYLKEYGMQLVDERCDADIRLVRLNTATTSERSLLLGPLVSPTTYSAMDGVVTIVVRDTTVVADEPVRASKSTTTVAAINSFVWYGLKPAITRYRRSSEPR